MNTSIFGTGSPQLIYDPSGTPATVNLTYFLPTNDAPESSRAESIESQLTADRFILTRGGDFWEYSGWYYLWKESTNIATVRAKFEDIYQYNRQLVALKKHSDGDYFRDDDDAIILFYFECFPRNIGAAIGGDLLDYRDVLYMTFRSLKAPNFANMNDA
jgi:hypothetical protein